MNPEAAPQNNTPNPDIEDPNLDLNVNESTEETAELAEQPLEAPEQSMEEMEGLHRVAAGASDVLEQAINGERKINTGYTEDGLRGVVEANVSGGTVQGQFDGSELKKVELGLDDDHTITVEHPESANPKAFIDGQPVDPDKMPAVEQVIQEIKTATAAKSEETLPKELTSVEETVAEDDNEKLAA